MTVEFSSKGKPANFFLLRNAGNFSKSSDKPELNQVHFGGKNQSEVIYEKRFKDSAAEICINIPFNKHKNDFQKALILPFLLSNILQCRTSVDIV